MAGRPLNVSGTKNCQSSCTNPPTYLEDPPTHVEHQLSGCDNQVNTTGPHTAVDLIWQSLTHIDRGLTSCTQPASENEAPLPHPFHQAGRELVYKEPMTFDHEQKKNTDTELCFQSRLHSNPLIVDGRDPQLQKMSYTSCDSCELQKQVLCILP